MATSVPHQSRQSAYPLQAPIERSRRSSIATNDSGESRSRRRYSIVSQQGSGGNGCPYQHQVQGNNVRDSSLVAPAVQQLPSPLLNEYGNHRLSGNSNITSSLWSRASQIVQPNEQISPKRDSITSVPKSDHTIERPVSQSSNASSNGTIGKTLRRTPRSRRIDSPIQMHRNDDGHADSSGSLGAELWGRQTYPLQSNPDSLPGTSITSSGLRNTAESAKRTISNGTYVNSEASEHPADAERPRYLPASQHEPVSSARSIELRDHASKNSSNTQQSPGQQHAEKANKAWHRRAYPLQAPASNATLRALPTPPPSPPSERSSDHTQHSAGHTTSSKTNGSVAGSFRRKAYPLQAPASTVDLRNGNDSPPLDDVIQPETKEQAVQQSPKNDPPRAVNKSLRRLAYPLQSPASIPDLQHEAATETSEKEVPHSDLPTAPTAPVATAAEVQTPEVQPAPRKAINKSLRRQVYPLQSPASIVDLQQGESVPTSKNDTQIENSSPETKPSEPPAQRRVQSLRRQIYPLQAPASIADLQHAQSSTPPEGADTAVEQTVDQQSVAKSEPVQTSKPLRRQPYPLQTSTSVTQPKQVHSTEDVVNDETVEKGEEKVDKDETFEIKHPHRQTYPLQAPATAVEGEDKQLPSSPLDQSPIQDTDPPFVQALPKIQTEDIASPTVLSPLWRRKTYPLHTPEDVVPSRSATPQPPAEEPRDPNSILLPKHIPAVHDADQLNSHGRTIVVCLDGTGDKFDADNSNIIHLVSALKKDDSRQVTYYQAGIGTYSSGGLSSGFAAAMDMAVGSGLGLHVRDAYHFLMHTYKEGDKICIFGFSRGAYTARCLAGMVHKVGLLPPRNIQQIPFAYEFYSMDSPEGWKQSADFKKTFSIDINIYFLGCFDSVASVGFIPRQLPLSSTPKNKPLYFRHAMALDERRAKFKICRHQTKKWEEIEQGAVTPSGGLLEAAHSALPNYADQNDSPKLYSPSSYGVKNHPNLTDEEYKRLMAPADEFDTNVLEVWFAGAHADVGGGAVPNIERHKLAQIPLRWMIRQAFECNTGILFKTKVLAEHGLDVHTLWPKYESLKVPSHGPPPSFLERYEDGLPPRSIRQSKLVATDEQDNGEPLLHLKSHMDDDWTPEQIEDFYDAISPLNDQLVQAPGWWILEAWPVQLKMPVEPGKYYVRTGLNLGRYRAVEDIEPNLHWTVVHRMQHMGYKLGVRDTKNTRWRTVV